MIQRLLTPFAGCLLMLVSLGACNWTDTRHIPETVGSTPLLLTTADLRLISERPAPDGSGRTIVCAEPPPDVAKALSTAQQASLGVTTAASVGGNAAASFASAEQLAQLAGRIPGVQALRDGLYRACEAYANGIIGDSAYALTLSRYGEMLVTVVLAESASSSSASQLATLAGLNLLAPAASTAPTAKSAPETPPAAPQAAAPQAATQLQPNPAGTTATILPATWAGETGSPAPRAQGVRPDLVHLIKLDRSALALNVLGVIKAAGAEPGARPPALAPPAADNPVAEAPAAGTKVTIKLSTGETLSCAFPTGAGTAANTLDCTVVTPPASGAKPAPATPPKTAPVSTGSTPNTAGTAQAIQQMQQNYLTLSVTAPLLVACISEYDPTRLATKTKPVPSFMQSDTELVLMHNTLLRKHCPDFFTALNAKVTADAALTQAQATALAKGKASPAPGK